ncbi:phage infection protein [Pseudomonas sp. TMP9]|uniref:phage infection protein n=1 Tax=Pseudomonas sp. TMP9 TaxID=3133144 RepID=UPI0030D3B40D
MKKQILTAVILSSLSISALALPQKNPQQLLGEMHDSSVKTLMDVGRNLQTEGGAERVHERQMERMQVAEGGAEQLLEQRMRVAEGGAERLLEQRMRVAEGGAERTGLNRIAEGGAERTINQRIG